MKFLKKKNTLGPREGGSQKDTRERGRHHQRRNRETRRVLQSVVVVECTTHLFFEN